MRLNRIKAALDQRDLSAMEGQPLREAEGRPVWQLLHRINDQWRITFRIEDNRALDVTIEDHH